MSSADTPPAPPEGLPESEAYRSQAGHYDRRTDAFRQWRELLVESLPVRPGDTVLDVGCGTGLCAPLLHRQVGPTGTIIGIDESEQMLAIAAHRVTEHGWDNVRLIAAPVATAPIDGLADAALFCAVHDIMQSPAALDNIIGHLRPGSPVAATGGKQPALWMWPLRPWVIRLHRPFITDFTGFDQPWRLLARHVPDLQVRELAFTAGYLAVGHTPVVRQMRKPYGGQTKQSLTKRANIAPLERPLPRMLQRRSAVRSSRCCPAWSALVGAVSCPSLALRRGFFGYLTAERGLRPESIVPCRHHLARFGPS